ncbi:MAG: hypothetical protein WCS35_05085, partial [Sphaerochaeta sp.]
MADTCCVVHYGAFSCITRNQEIHALSHKRLQDELFQVTRLFRIPIPCCKKIENTIKYLWLYPIFIVCSAFFHRGELLLSQNKETRADWLKGGQHEHEE